MKKSKDVNRVKSPIEKCRNFKKKHEADYEKKYEKGTIFDSRITKYE